MINFHIFAYSVAICVLNSSLGFNCQILGGKVNGTLTSQVSEIGNWTLNQISDFTGIPGNHSIQNITNIQTQITSGINYYLTIM